MTIGSGVGLARVVSGRVSVDAGSITEVATWGLGEVHPTIILTIPKITMSVIHNRVFFRNIVYETFCLQSIAWSVPYAYHD
jgi:hypothetical protein